MRFYGEVGYGVQVETRPGIWETEIREATLRGEIDRLAMSTGDDAEVNPGFRVTHALRVLASPEAREHFATIKYVRWAGAVWAVTTVEVLPPRLIIRLGGVYTGKKLSQPPSPPGGTG